MGLFSKMSEDRRQQRESEKQRLNNLSEKELMIEILLELKKLNNQGRKIAHKMI